MICILDYGSGNVRSVYNRVSQIADCKVSNEKNDIVNSQHLIIPGVGSFGASMKQISNKFPLDVLFSEIAKGKPVLGICVGMQVLSEKGLEFYEEQGLGLVSGVVRKINSEELVLPHVGWNNLINIRECPLTLGITEEDDFYFVHSYRIDRISPEFIVSEAEYGEVFPAIIRRNNLYGVQFHPEKSQEAGFKILRNFVNIK